VTMNTTVDSNAGGAAGRTYNATVVSATTVAGVTVPQGSHAITTLLQSGNGWTLSLSSIAANGQSIPISNSVPSISGGKISGALQNAMGGNFGNPFSKAGKKAAASNGPQVAASGARVYIPANTPVAFAVTAANQNRQNQAPVNQPTAVQTPATPTTPVNPTTPVTPQQQPSQPSAGNTTVVFGNIKYQLTGCHREAPHIVCELQVTNLGAVDAALMGSGRTYFIDQSGNRGAINSASIANCNLGRCEMLPNIGMKARYIFMDDTGESRTLVRLQIFSGNSAVAQFTNVAVQ